ncbi:hypothetical protein WMY93_018412, partial [Mugilogobius chulae]
MIRTRRTNVTPPHDTPPHDTPPYDSKVSTRIRETDIAAEKKRTSTEIDVIGRERVKAKQPLRNLLLLLSKWLELWLPNKEVVGLTPGSDHINISRSLWVEFACSPRVTVGFLRFPPTSKNIKLATVQGVPRLRPKVTGIGSSHPRPLTGLSAVRLTDSCTFDSHVYVRLTAVMRPVVVVHGGAGHIPSERAHGSTSGVCAAVKAGYSLLTAGGSSLDAVVEAVSNMEDNPHFNAGCGSVLTASGQVEMDALVMDGRNLSAGTVSAVSNIANPVKLARLVMDKTSHVCLTAGGAAVFARQMGVQEVPTESLITEYSRARWRKNLQPGANPVECQMGKMGTVGAVAVDSEGNVACATSTGGILNKMDGRVGDTPCIGLFLLRLYLRSRYSLAPAATTREREGKRGGGGGRGKREGERQERERERGGERERERREREEREGRRREREGGERERGKRERGREERGRGERKERGGTERGKREGGGEGERREGGKRERRRERERKERERGREKGRRERVRVERGRKGRERELKRERGKREGGGEREGGERRKREEEKERGEREWKERLTLQSPSGASKAADNTSTEQPLLFSLNQTRRWRRGANSRLNAETSLFRTLKPIRRLEGQMKLRAHTETRRVHEPGPTAALPHSASAPQRLCPTAPPPHSAPQRPQRLCPTAPHSAHSASAPQRLRPTAPHSGSAPQRLRPQRPTAPTAALPHSASATPPQRPQRLCPSPAPQRLRPTRLRPTAPPTAPPPHSSSHSAPPTAPSAGFTTFLMKICRSARCCCDRVRCDKDGGYADDSVGAVSTTGHGEAIMKVVLARLILFHLEH